MFYKTYDSILISDVPENTPKRFYISKTNEYMINKFKNKEDKEILEFIKDRK